MIDLYYAPTPNGLKVRLFLEETGLPYRIQRVDLAKGEQFAPDFLAISPNNKIPAIVDRAPVPNDGPLAVFESGAILIYLAEKTGELLPILPRERLDTLQWLFWQVGGLGPMAGQMGHFNVYAPERVPYALNRYRNEVRRLYGVLDRRLADRDFVAGEYSIADIAIFPWIVPHEAHDQRLDDFPHLRRWYDALGARPAVQRAYEGVGDTYRPKQPLSAEARQHLFGAGARPPGT